MDNKRIINITIKFKIKLRFELENNDSHSQDMKYWIWKTLIMAEIAHRSFSIDVNIEKFEKQYFDRYAAVARHFRDWAMDWVADNYFEISHYIATYYWPDKNKDGFNQGYKPFETFQLD